MGLHKVLIEGLIDNNITYQWVHHSEVLCDWHHSKYIGNKVAYKYLGIVSCLHKASDFYTQIRPVIEKFLVTIC